MARAWMRTLATALLLVSVCASRAWAHGDGLWQVGAVVIFFLLAACYAIAVFVAEAVVYRTAFKITWERAFLCSMLCNIAAMLASAVFRSGLHIIGADQWPAAIRWVFWPLGLVAPVSAEVGTLYLLNPAFEPRRQLLRVGAITNGITYLLPFIPVLVMQVGTARTQSGYRPQVTAAQLHQAIRDGDTPRVRKLLERGTSANCTVSSNGPKTLHIAVASRQPGIARLLQDFGADINATAYVGDTPLRWAMRRNDVQAVSLLLEWGADARTALQTAQETSRLANDSYHRRYEPAKSAAAAQVLQLVETAASRSRRIGQE